MFLLNHDQQQSSSRDNTQDSRIICVNGRQTKPSKVHTSFYILFFQRNEVFSYKTIPSLSPFMLDLFAHFLNLLFLEHICVNRGGGLSSFLIAQKTWFSTTTYIVVGHSSLVLFFFESRKVFLPSASRLQSQIVHDKSAFYFVRPIKSFPQFRSSFKI